jgi:rare lipoprotein A
MNNKFKNRSFILILLSLFALISCAETELIVHTAKTVRSDTKPAPVKKYKIGKPYEIQGVWYYPAENLNYTETGIASWYGPNFHGKYTANGEIFDQNLITAAHRTLPLPSVVKVTNLENGRTISMRVNDRGPFARNRIIDISRRGAQLLGFKEKGTAKVKVVILPDESRRIKIATLNNKNYKLNQPKILSSPREIIEEKVLPNFGDKRQTTKKIGMVSAFRPKLVISKLSEKIEQVPIGITGIYIQTGTYSKLENALKMRDRVYNLGPTQISRYNVFGREVYRVRVGPLDNVPIADETLIKLNNVGVLDARIIVE